MPARIEDYALIGDMQTAALVARDGSIDWLCLPRFDSAAVFAHLLGSEDHGLWRIGPTYPGHRLAPAATRRRYRPDTLILESEWDTPTGRVRVTDLMPPRDVAPQTIRIVEGLDGTVTMRSTLRMRFGYGLVVPWVDATADGRLRSVAGPDSLWLDTDAHTYGEEQTTYADFTVRAGQRVTFALSWQPSHQGPPPIPDAIEAMESTEKLLCAYLETIWNRPDEGIWEIRGPRRHFVHSKVMAWAAVDRTILLVESGGATVEPGVLERWRTLRDTIHDQVCTSGYDRVRNTFTQSYGSPVLDASLLPIPQTGFLPADDPRVVGTIEAVQRELSTPDGFLLRYPTAGTAPGVDGLEGDEGAFLACSFWLVDALLMLGRTGEAHLLLEKLLALRNDLGLLAEEWDPKARRQVGNYPQAFSHVALCDSAAEAATCGAAGEQL
ncbi:glycoside hydrolase family 15 protein [Streptomyces sp. NPDC001502]|uniref:glycoside hydrolase family 15 protein n=1 Tax=Streptomyces sp. NPDC001502 TaxID=3364578 RepID=UPI0036BA2D63